LLPLPAAASHQLLLALLPLGSQPLLLLLLLGLLLLVVAYKSWQWQQLQQHVAAVFGALAPETAGCLLQPLALPYS
jgi:hypothetical protein